MNTKYTPGPWEIGQFPDGFKLEVRANDGLVATVRGASGTKAMTRANARLIAAAPEMLEALNKCEDVIGTAVLHGHLIDNPHSPVWEALREARAAIDKTRGEIQHKEVPSPLNDDELDACEEANLKGLR